MCLHFTIVPAKTNVVSAARLAELSGLVVRKIKGEFVFGQDCSCVLLEPNAANGEYVPLAAAVVEPLARVFKTIAKDAAGFRLSVLWPNYADIEEIVGESRMPLNAFCKILQVTNSETLTVTSLGASAN